MVLLDEVVEIFGLADFDRRFTISVDRFERGEIGTAFVDGHLLGDAIEVPQVQRIGHVSAHTNQDHLERKMQAFEHSGHRRIQRLHRASSRSCRSAHHS